jgi:hypothetical protein
MIGILSCLLSIMFYYLKTGMPTFLCSLLQWDSYLAYPNLLGTKGFDVVVAVAPLA